MDYFYYPGCTVKTSASNLEWTAFAIMKALGHNLVEMEEWNCCGVVASLTDDDLMKHLGPLRNLIHVEDQGGDKVITLCDMCNNTLKQTNLRMTESEEDLKTMNDFMDEENDYQKTVKVLHFLEFLRDEVGFAVLKKKVKNPLKGLKIMPYYGCNLLRPREVAIDDAEDPTILSDLIKVLGAEVVENPFSVECCGSYHTLTEKEIVSSRAMTISKYATEREADSIMLSCPLCRFNLDVRGYDAEKANEGYTQIPTYYYTQLIVLALGLDAEVCGFDIHCVDPLPLLKDKGILS